MNLLREATAASSLLPPMDFSGICFDMACHNHRTESDLQSQDLEKVLSSIFREKALSWKWLCLFCQISICSIHHTRPKVVVAIGGQLFEREYFFG